MPWVTECFQRRRRNIYRTTSFPHVPAWISGSGVGLINRLRRYRQRDKTKPWVFWHTYWSNKTGQKKEGPYKDRKRIMKALCKKAGVKYFRFHAIRHFGASIMDNANVPIGSIQRILGHEIRRTTEIYLHSIGEAERDAMVVFEAECEKKALTDSLTEKNKESQPNL